MTVKELADISNTNIKVKDAKDGKILCYRYTDNKNSKISDRIILSIWTEIEVFNSGYGSTAKPIICVYVEHVNEYTTIRKDD